MAEEKTTDKKEKTGLDQFSLDKVKGFEMGAIKSKTVDQSATDEYLSQIEKPTGGSVYDKMAARYRSQGEGAVLRTQKNLNNLFLPTINLIKEREAAAEARFTLLKDKMPEFDDSTIFGNQSGNEMPIKDYVMGISKSVKEDLRMLSRLNINDERYDEVKKRVEKNQDAIVNFDEINKKLLEIRNSQDGREDHTQWSKGMDQTTIDMWTDIYSSKGENIKIVDGKLVWTGTETSYEFEEGSYDDDKFEALGAYATDLGNLAAFTRNNQGNQYTFENGEKNGVVDQVQEQLIESGFTDADGNELDPDGEWGDKSQAAYDKYLAQKDGLEKAYLDENYEGDAKKTSGTGGTRTIDLSQIGDGPTLIDNKGTNMDIALRGETQKFIEMGGKVDDPMYNQMIKSKLSELNKIGPQGFKSLIFDGIGLEDTDMFTGSNTDSFIEKVIADTYAGGDMSKLSEKEIEGHIQEMKSGDVTLPYNTGEIDPQTGKPVTSSLQSLFMKWYKGEIDDAITEGVKSKLVESPNQNNNNNNKRKKRPPETSALDFNEAVEGLENGVFTKLPTRAITYNGKRFDADEIQMGVDKGQYYIQYVPGDSETKEMLSKSEYTKMLMEFYGKGSEEEIKKQIDNQFAEDKQKSEGNIKDAEVASNSSADGRINKLLLKNVSFGEIDTKDYLLSYGNDKRVIDSLNGEYADLGFTFEYASAEIRRGTAMLGTEEYFGDNDTLVVFHKNDPNKRYSIRFDTTFDDVKNTKMLIGIMKSMTNNNYAAASKFVEQLTN